MFEHKVFRKQMHCIEESACVIVRSFGRPPQYFSAPRVIRRPWNCALLVTPLLVEPQYSVKKLQMYTLANNLPLCDKNALNVLD